MVPAKLTNWLLEFHLCWVFCMFSPSTHSKIGHAAKVGQNHLQRLAQFSQSSFDKKKCVLSSQPNQEIWDVNLRYKKLTTQHFGLQMKMDRPVPSPKVCHALRRQLFFLGGWPLQLKIPNLWRVLGVVSSYVGSITGSFSHLLTNELPSNRVKSGNRHFNQHMHWLMLLHIDTLINTSIDWYYFIFDLISTSINF